MKNRAREARAVPAQEFQSKKQRGIVPAGNSEIEACFLFMPAAPDKGTFWGHSDPRRLEHHPANHQSQQHSFQGSADKPPISQVRRIFPSDIGPCAFVLVFLLLAQRVLRALRLADTAGEKGPERKL